MSSALGSGMKITALFAALASTHCVRASLGPGSALVEMNGRDVPTPNGTLVLDGFIAGGSYSERQSEAVSSAISQCESLIVQMMEFVGRFRLHYKRSQSYSERCGKPENETPFGRGYLYVFRPQMQIQVDPEDEIIEVAGPAIEGTEAPQHMLYDAYTSFNARCFAEGARLRSEMGTALVAFSCGKAETKTRMEFLPSHGREMPNLLLQSQMKIYLRRNDPGRTAEVQNVRLQSLFQVSLVDSIESIVPGHTEYPSVLTTHFPGVIAKVDLRQKRLLWEKNLTNPEPSSVRQTTGLTAVSASHDGEVVAVGASYGYLALLDGDTGIKTKILTCDRKMFAGKHYTALHIESSKRYLYSVAQLTTYPDQSTNYNRMSFPDLQQAKEVNLELTQWDLQTGKALWSIPLKGGGALAAGTNHDLSFVYAVTTDRVTVFAALDGKLIKEFPLSHYEAHLAGSLITGASFSDDMRLLAISAFSGVMLINTQTTKMVRRFRAQLKTELGNPEISLETDSIRAFDAYGNIYQWSMGSGALIGQGKDESIALNYNGPLNMPILSMDRGSYMVHSNFHSASGGVGVSIPRAQTVHAQENICQAGPGSELPAVTVRRGAQLNVWSVEFVPSE